MSRADCFTGITLILMTAQEIVKNKARTLEYLAHNLETNQPVQGTHQSTGDFLSTISVTA
jgi:hypothetical protein